MATSCVCACRKTTQNLARTRIFIRAFSQQKQRYNTNSKRSLFIAVSSSGLLSWLVYQRFSSGSLKFSLPTIQAREAIDSKTGGALSLTPATQAKKGDVGKKVVQKQHYRELRFMQFASVEYAGSAYMTPQDFLESVTEEVPRPRIGRLKLTDRDLDAIMKHTPQKDKRSQKLFRNILAQGIISYTEYLFLLCVLTKPESGFRIAFNMFDMDGNQIVDKKEFMVLGKLFTRLTGYRDPPNEDGNKLKPIRDVVGLEKVLTLVPGGGYVEPNPDLKPLNEVVGLEEVFGATARHLYWQQSGCGLQNMDHDGNVVNTTLLVHFFGPKGKDVLRFVDFKRFMQNLQTEVLELEFKAFSKGMPTISEVEFARILLRYTLLDKAEIDKCVARVQERIPEEKVKGITFGDFKQFCTFLNNLDDFAIAMNLYTMAGEAISQEEFQRAVLVCTGCMLQPHIVNTVFQIFDKDGDGHLGHHEFISIMKNRLHRGSRSHLMHTESRWDAFKSCVKTEMKSP